MLQHHDCIQLQARCVLGNSESLTSCVTSNSCACRVCVQHLWRDRGLLAAGYRLGFSSLSDISACLTGLQMTLPQANLWLGRSRKIDLGFGVSALVSAVAFAAMMSDLVSLRVLVCKPWRSLRRCT